MRLIFYYKKRIVYITSTFIFKKNYIFSENKYFCICVYFCDRQFAGKEYCNVVVPAALSSA